MAASSSTSSSSYPTIQIDIRSPPAAALQSSIQNNLISRGWVDPSDPMMAEYVLVMLANAKGRQDIDQELAELIGEGIYQPDFTQWLWDEAHRILQLGQLMETETSTEAKAEAESSNGPSRSSQQRQRTVSPIASKSSEPSNRQQPTRADRSARGGANRSRDAPDARSRSPGFRRSASPDARDARHGLRSADHWEPRDDRRGEASGRSGRGGQQAIRQQRPPRELFASARSQLEDPSSRLSPPKPSDSAMEEDTMEATSDASPLTASKEVRIRGSAPSRHEVNAGRELFSRSMSAATGSTSQPTAIPTGPRSMLSAPPTNGLSLLARAGVPDPRAPAFVPNFHGQAGQPAPLPQSLSLSSRLDPMLPVNAPLPMSLDGSQSVPTQASTFPAKPLQSSLCRYASACTNPMCEYSHPSPRASLAKRRGEIKEDPILTSQLPCKFGVECNNVECTFSHVSPAVFFLSGSKGAADGSAATSARAGMLGAESTSVPCRFNDQCSNPSCAYRHVDATGKVVPSPALARLLNPSHATSQHTQGSADVESSTGSADAVGSKSDSYHNGNSDGGATAPPSASEKGPDGKPLALDRPLPTDNGGGLGATKGVNGNKASTARPCKFEGACTRPGCWFSHPPGHQLKGRILDAGSAPGGSTGGIQVQLHISDRLKRFDAHPRRGEGGADGDDDEEEEQDAGVERILPGVRD